MSRKNIAKVLLIVTGGTFCMVQSENGYVPAPNLHERLKKISCFYDTEMATKLGLDEFTLVTPMTPNKHFICYRVLEFEKLIDSSNVAPSDYVKIVKVIEENYKEYDGFVVCHGTDTMAYTASALSFMLENLNKTVVLTGS